MVQSPALLSTWRRHVGSVTDTAWMRSPSGPSQYGLIKDIALGHGAGQQAESTIDEASSALNALPLILAAHSLLQRPVDPVATQAKIINAAPLTTNTSARLNAGQCASPARAIQVIHYRANAQVVDRVRCPAPPIMQHVGGKFKTAAHLARPIKRVLTARPARRRGTVASPALGQKTNAVPGSGHERG